MEKLILLWKDTLSGSFFAKKHEHSGGILTKCESEGGTTEGNIFLCVNTFFFHILGGSEGGNQAI